jgi:hypothetical protein
VHGDCITRAFGLRSICVCWCGPQRIWVAFEWTNLADAQTLQRYSTFDLNPGLKAIVI